MRHGAYCDEAVVDAVAADAAAVDLRLRRRRDVPRRPRHRLSRADRSRPGSAGRGAAGARRRRRRRPGRGRDRQDAGRHRDRGRLERGKACDRAGAGAPIISCSTIASRSATPSSASPTGAAPTWCSIPSAARCSRTAMRCITWGARLLIIGFTGGIGLAKTNLLMIKGASVLGVRAGEAVRKNPALGEGQDQGADRMGGGGQDPPQHLAPPAAGRLCQGDAAVDRPQGDRPRGADDAVSVSSSCRAHAGHAVRGLRLNRRRLGLLDHPPSRMRHCGRYVALPPYGAAAFTATFTYTRARSTTGNSPACRRKPCS